MVKKTVVIGLDGFEPTLLEKWRDDLLNLNSLIESGFYSRLRSTVPIGSGPSWTTFTTGKDPWNHDIYDFHHRENGSRKEGAIITSDEVESERIWNYLNDSGFRTGVVNLAVTYPPEKIDGFMISSFLAPPDSESFTYPKDLRKKLPHERPEFDIVEDLDLEGVEKVLESIWDTTEERKENVLWLMENEDWDFFVFNLQGPDKIAHKCWHLLDDNHPHHTEQLSEKLDNAYFKYYQYIDEIIGEFLDSLPEQTNIFVISDHGTGSANESGGTFKHAKTELLQLFLKSNWTKRKNLLKKALRKILPTPKNSSNSEKNDKPPKITGDHKFHGILIASGPNIKEKEQVKNPGIVDLAPTLLHIYNIPIPKDMDGKPLTKILTKNTTDQCSVKFQEPKKFQKEFLKETISKTDQEKIKQKLNNLGYLD